MILIVDDRPENIFSLRKILESDGLKVDSATSGPEALRKVLKNSYELIILDVQMPEMDGYEVAELIKGSSRGKDIPILFLSAVATDKRFITQGYKRGAMDYITKPADPDILLLKVKNFCLLSRQTQALYAMQETLKGEIAMRKEAQEGLEAKVAERTKELVETARLLQESNIELQQFASVASHDLQEPLRKILIFIGLIKEQLDETTDIQISQYLERIGLAAERMKALVRDILSFTSLSVKDLIESVSLDELFAEVLKDFEVTIQEKKAIVEIGPLTSLDVVPGPMRQVFQNLLSNALKFANKEAEARISVKGEPVENEGVPHYRIWVADNGIGFEDEYAEKIFSIFQRLHNKEDYAGTGIGLAIARKIVEKHNGIITATGKAGEGATFIITLPVKHASAAQ